MEHANKEKVAKGRKGRKGREKQPMAVSMMKMAGLAGPPSGGGVHDAGRRPARWLMPALMAAALVMALSISVAATKQADAAATSGKAFGWGYNSDGELGNGNTDDRNTPEAVGSLKGVKSVKAGCSHGLALLENGTVRAWGRNDDGQLGNGTSGDGTDSDDPVRVSNLTNVKAISAGCEHSMALKEDGSVWAWGDNFYGELGNGTSGDGTDSDGPIKVGSLGTGAKGIDAGYYFSLTLMKNGTVKSWGYNGYGSLGNGFSGNGTDTNTPGAVTGLSNVKSISADSYTQHALALLNNGTVRAWGGNSESQLGDGTNDDSTTPVAVKNLSGVNLSGVKSIGTGGYHSLAVLNNGTVKSWGENEYGALGDGTTDDSNVPVSVSNLSNVRFVSGGAYQSLAVLNNGTARSWGYNEYGELGNGKDDSDYTPDEPQEPDPVRVSNLTNVRSMDGGYFFTLASKN